MKSLPERGRIGIFNRSYYEDVLVVKVHPELIDQQKLPAGKRGKSFWEARYEDINAFERHLARNGMVRYRASASSRSTFGGRGSLPTALPDHLHQARMQHGPGTGPALAGHPSEPPQVIENEDRDTHEDAYNQGVSGYCISETTTGLVETVSPRIFSKTNR
jgi:hypothetical protein